MHIIDAFADLPEKTLTCFTNIVFCASVNYTCVYMYMHVHHGCLPFADSHEVLCRVSRTFCFVHQLSVHAHACICMAIIDAFADLPRITLLCQRKPLNAWTEAWMGWTGQREGGQGPDPTPRAQRPGPPPTTPLTTPPTLPPYPLPPTHLPFHGAV